MTDLDLADHESFARGNASWRSPRHFLDAMDNPWYRNLVDVQDVLTRSTFTFFGQRTLKAVQLPITTTSISSPMGLGSDSSPVAIDLFGVETYLADSMQFLLEYACRYSEAGAFYVMPSFRGEPADETHLCQFYHAEAEIPGGQDEIIALAEAYVRGLTADIAGSCAAVLGALPDRSHVDRLLERNRPFDQVTLKEAISVLRDDPAFVRHHPEGFRTLTRLGERQLIESFGGFVWVTEQDHLAVPFYQAYVENQSGQAKAADLLFGLGEVIGSGERHRSAAHVAEALRRHQVDPGPYEWYLQMRDARPLRTAGFGMGTERYVAWLMGHDDIRDCQLVPRFNGERALP